MGINRVYFLVLFILSDAFFTFLSLGFFGSELKFSFSIIYQKVFLLDGYSFTQSPFDFIIFLVIRTFLLISAALLIALNKDKIIEKLSLPCLGFSITTVSYTIVKLLAFSENEELLYYPGLWFILTWSWIVSPLFCVLWYLSLSNYPMDYTRLFNPDEEQPATESNEESTDSDGILPSEKTDKMSTWKHVKRLLAFCLKEWPWFLAGVFFLLTYSAVRIFIPYYTGIVIGNIVHVRGYDVLFRSVAIMTGLTLASTVLGGFRGGCFDYATSLVARRVRRDLFTSLVKQDIAFFDVTKTGEMVSRLTSDCQSISDSVAVNINIFSRNGIMLLGALFFMFSLSWRLALLTFVAIPVIAYVTKVYGVFFDKLSEKMQKTIANANQTAEEVLSTMRTVRSFACENREARRFESMLDDTLTIGWKRAIGYVGSNWTNEFSNNAILVAVLAYGGHLVISNRLSSDNFISFLIYQMQLGENLYSIGWVFTGMMQSVGASRKVFEYINRPPKIPNDGDCVAPVQGDIKMDALSFVYPNRPKNPVLKGLSLHIRAGETVALVGPSGGGKSSIVSLLEHFYEPNEGEITLDGVAIRDYDHMYYHQKVALVSQEPVLYDGTVRHNISYGCDWATEDMIIEAAKTANVHNFVMELDKGYDTNCGEKGVQMSGGQKQRIAIARALIRKPAVLILDEATSALDAESESVVQEALNSCAVGHTVLIIAHRLSTIEKADRIAVINKGQVVQMGTHSELMDDSDGLYFTLVSRQVKHGIKIQMDSSSIRFLPRLILPSKSSKIQLMRENLERI
ncbi:hypothetical protein PFISCL1PPCAC_15364, partial [Pristionchus fissidentatus]